ncbi:MAG: polyphosphate glucokinase [Saprospiraceae bacterium]|nr:MAG: polyphosphate glucokinase [Saprospiraceae bacterium]
MTNKNVLGIDVGASGIKGGIVDIKTGALISERLRLETPVPATPKNMAKTFSELVKMHDWKGMIGCGFPSIVRNGMACSAANIDKKWKGVNIEKVFSKATQCPVTVVNDADAAGLAVMRYGLGKDKSGTVLVLTIGSGIGSALFVDGKLVSNTEFGHVYFKRKIAEHIVSNNARKQENLSWEDWGRRFNQYLKYIGRILSPDCVILSGGGSKKFELYQEFINVKFPVMPSQLLNDAGTVGAALYAWEKTQNK